MEVDPLAIWQTSLWLIPLILLGCAGLAYVSVRWWQSRTFQEMKNLRAALRELHNQRKNILLSIRGRSHDEPEPFGSRLNALFTNLNQLHSQATTIEARLSGVQRNIHYLRSRRWEVIVGAPYFWYLLNQDLTRIQQEMQRAQATLLASQEIKAQLDGVVGDVVKQARDAVQTLQQYQQRLETLLAKHLTGKAVEALGKQIQHIQSSLASIPADFLQEEMDLSKGADQARVASIYNLLLDNQPLIVETGRQLSGWEEHLELIHQKATAVRQGLKDLRATINALPAPINAESIQAELSRVQLRSEDLQAALEALDVEQMEKWLFEAEELAQKLPSMKARLQAAREAQSQLEVELHSLREDLRRLSFLFADMSTHAIYPVTWGESMRRFTEIQQQVKSLGEAHQRRTPEEISRTLEGARELHAHVDRLSMHLRALHEMHTQLLRLDAAPAPKEVQQWLKSSLEIASTAQEYAIENWPRQVAAHDLAHELDAFHSRYASLLGAEKNHPITEKQIPERLAQMRTFQQEYAHLAQFVESVAAQLQKVRARESAALESLNNAQALLTQMELLAQSNAFLAEIAARPLEQFHSEAQKLKQQLEDKRHGAIDKKASRVAAFTGTIEAQANQWLRKLSQATLEKSRHIRQTIQTLDTIAHIEEQALSHADQVAVEVEAGNQRITRLSLEEVLPQLKLQCDLWQKCKAAQTALEDMAHPLLLAFEEAQKQRQETLQELETLSKELEQPRAWPPTSITLEGEQQELLQIEEQWERVKEQPQRAIRLVASLGNLKSKYQTLYEHLRQDQERLRRERAQVSELEDELKELVMQWQQQWHSNRDQPQVRRQIDQLLDELDAEWNQLKRRYWRGEVKYPHVLASLKSLQNTLRTHEVDIDGEYTLDILGRIRRKR